MAANNPVVTRYWTYDTAPMSPELQGMDITPRQLKRAVQLCKIGYVKPGLRVLFSDDDLREFVQHSSVKPVR